MTEKSSYLVKHEDCLAFCHVSRAMGVSPPLSFTPTHHTKAVSAVAHNANMPEVIMHPATIGNRF